MSHSLTHSHTYIATQTIYVFNAYIQIIQIYTNEFIHAVSVSSMTTEIVYYYILLYTNEWQHKMLVSVYTCETGSSIPSSEHTLKIIIFFQLVKQNSILFFAHDSNRMGCCVYFFHKSQWREWMSGYSWRKKKNAHANEYYFRCTILLIGGLYLSCETNNNNNNKYHNKNVF